MDTNPLALKGRATAVAPPSLSPSAIGVHLFLKRRNINVPENLQLTQNQAVMRGVFNRGDGYNANV